VSSALHFIDTKLVFEPQQGCALGTLPLPLSHFFVSSTNEVRPMRTDIHNRRPVILALDNYSRRLGYEPDPRDVMWLFSSCADADVADLDASQQTRE
jgi:hypothetical protein